MDEIIATIEELKRKRTDISNRITQLQGRLRVADEKPEPIFFDYKDAILSAFRAQEAGAVLKIAVIEQFIASHYGFTPDKITLAARIGYLLDRDKDKLIERVKGRRGFYRLRATDAATKSIV